MKKPVLVLLALLVLIPFAQAMAQTSAAPATDAATAQFLATLAGGQAPGDLTPAPTFMTGCGTGPACPTSKLCCNVCGADPGGDPSSCLRCVTPIRGRCPLVV
jgi:hypothetical protein